MGGIITRSSPWIRNGGDVYYNNGNVGIGTTVPLGLLHLNKNVAGGDVAAIIQNEKGGGSVSETVSLIFSQAAMRACGKIVAGRELDYSTAANRDSFMDFYTSLDDLDTVKIRITSVGNLGIGTVTPAGLLTIGSGTKHDGYVITATAEVQTTDATATTLDSLTLLDENTYHIEAFVVGVKSDGSDRASYHLAVTVYRTAAGGATIQGSVTSLHTQESDFLWATFFATDGNDLTLRVSGVAATTIEWSSTITYINSSN